jgi:hypothetical protein
VLIAPREGENVPGTNGRPMSTRTLEQLLEQSRRLERRGRELMQQAKALAAQVAEARRAKREE